MSIAIVAASWFPSIEGDGEASRPRKYSLPEIRRHVAEHEQTVASLRDRLAGLAERYRDLLAEGADAPAFRRQSLAVEAHFERFKYNLQALELYRTQRTLEVLRIAAKYRELTRTMGEAIEDASFDTDDGTGIEDSELRAQVDLVSERYQRDVDALESALEAEFVEVNRLLENSPDEVDDLDVVLSEEFERMERLAAGRAPPEPPDLLLVDPTVDVLEPPKRDADAPADDGPTDDGPASRFHLEDPPDAARRGESSDATRQRGEPPDE